MNDQEDFFTSEVMDQLVRSADMGEDGQSVRLVVEQDWVVRGDQGSAVVADQGSPGILANETADNVGIVGGVQWIGTHAHMMTGHGLDAHSKSRGGRLSGVDYP